MSPELQKLAEELSESSLIMDYQFEILRKSFSNEIDTSTMLNLDNYSQSKIIHYLHLQERFKEVVNLAAPYFVFENSRHFQRANFIF